MQSMIAFLLINALLAAALAVVVLGLVLVVRRPAFAHRAWLIVMLKLVTPPLVVVPVIWPAALPSVPAFPLAERTTLVPAGQQLEVELIRVDGVGTVVEPPGEVAPAEDPPASPGPTAEWAALRPVESNTASVGPSTHDSSHPGTAYPVLRTWHLAFVVWLAGALAWWGLAATRVQRFRRLLRGSTSPAPESVRAEATSLAWRLGLRRVPTIEWINADVAPMVWAIFGRPRILLPQRLWLHLGEAQRSAVLAHELAHLRRGDHWVRRLELVVLGLYWWFPLVWWLRGRIEEAEESCCDAWVLWALPGSAATYAEALVETVSYLSRPDRVPLLASGAGRANGLKRRLMMILKQPPGHRLSWSALAGVLALAILALPWQFGLAEPTSEKAATPKPATTDPAAGPSATPAPSGGRGETPSAASGGSTPRPATADAAAPASGGMSSAPSRSGSGSATTSTEVQHLKDEVELLEAQREVKKAQLEAAAVAVRGALQQFALVEDSVKKGVGALSELNQARNQMESTRAQQIVREAELKEQEVKLTQAKRRLTGATSPREPMGSGFRMGPFGSGSMGGGGSGLPAATAMPMMSGGGLIGGQGTGTVGGREVVHVVHDFGVVGPEKATAKFSFKVQSKGKPVKLKEVTASEPGLMEVNAVTGRTEPGLVDVSCTIDGSKLTAKKEVTVVLTLAEPAGVRIQIGLTASPKNPESIAAARLVELEAVVKKLEGELAARDAETRKLRDQLQALKDGLVPK